MGIWLAGQSTAMMWIIAISVSAAFSLGGLYVVRATIAHGANHNDVLGFAHGVVGVVYAVLLAFTIVVSWERFDASVRSITEEANIFQDLFNDNRSLIVAFQDENGKLVKDLPPTGNALNTMMSSVQDYLNQVVYDEWDAMADGRESTVARESYAGIWRAYRAYSRVAVLTPAQVIFFGESLRELNELGAHRRTRLLSARASLPARFWTVLIAGGVLTIGFSWLYEVGNPRVHALIVVSLAGLIAVCLALIVSLEHPFRADGALLSQPLVDLQKTDPWPE